MDTINPYQAPTTTAPSQTGRVLFAAAAKSFVSVVLSFIAVAAYHVFVVFLVISQSRIDQIAGYLFLVNTPFQIIWLISTISAPSKSFLFGFVVASVQIVIAGIMLAFDIGDIEAVFMINGVIVVSIGLATLAAWRLTRRKEQQDA